MNLDKLIKDCIKQDRKSQEKLYQLYKNTLFTLCLKYCPNSMEAEDNLHDTFIEIFSTIKNYKGKGSFEGWMKRIAINKAITKYKKTYDLVPIKDNHVEEILLENDLNDYSLDYILSKVQELPNQYRLVFNLYELDDYSHKEIAQMLDISESTSKSNLHRAKIILKEKLTQVNPFNNNKSSNGKQ